MDEPMVRDAERRTKLRRYEDVTFRRFKRHVILAFVIFGLAGAGVLGLQQYQYQWQLERIDRDRVANCESGNQFRKGIREGLYEIADNTDNPEEFLDAAEPILRRTSPIDCNNP